MNFEKIRDKKITGKEGERPHINNYPIKIELNFLKVTLESSRKWNVLKCEKNYV